MSLRICPDCHKAFYVTDTDYCPPCPMCGYVLVEQREQGRIMQKSESTITFKEEKRSAQTLDLSPTGARIAYEGDALPVDTLFDFNVERLNVNRPAMAVWTKQTGMGQSQSGLRFL